MNGPLDLLFNPVVVSVYVSAYVLLIWQLRAINRRAEQDAEAGRPPSRIDRLTYRVIVYALVLIPLGWIVGVIQLFS